jgi:uncharacterized protein with FMN-binding domain
MRRAPLVLTATLVGTTAVLLYKPMAAGTGTIAAPSGTSSSASSSSGTSGSSSGSRSSAHAVVTGSAVTSRFGTTEVKVTIKNGRITDVTPVELNNADPRSNYISQTAAPMLREEVLSKQSAAVDSISGATYTSLAYEASLQAALDKAGYKAQDGSKASTSTPIAGGDD